MPSSARRPSESKATAAPSRVRLRTWPAKALGNPCLPASPASTGGRFGDLDGSDRRFPCPLLVFPTAITQGRLIELSHAARHPEMGAARVRDIECAIPISVRAGRLDARSAATSMLLEPRRLEVSAHCVLQVLADHPDILESERVGVQIPPVETTPRIAWVSGVHPGRRRRLPRVEVVAVVPPGRGTAQVPIERRDR